MSTREGQHSFLKPKDIRPSLTPSLGDCESLSCYYDSQELSVLVNETRCLESHLQSPSRSNILGLPQSIADLPPCDNVKSTLFPDITRWTYITSDQVRSPKYSFTSFDFKQVQSCHSQFNTRHKVSEVFNRETFEACLGRYVRRKSPLGICG